MKNFLHHLWNNGGPIALAHCLVPLYSSVWPSDGKYFRTVYIFGVRIIRYNTVKTS